ncbi:MAG TPA: DeoR/GlpR family DNA-binding transcription regulator [Oscillospiraceae bacterium]|jgi:DeoR/GlpR family transcriptional regulator of sugar metabolism|nr:transcriptional regulator, DeoR family [Oscillospiraceae bacterium]MDN5378677.1 hypothetical protein [Clostridiales bacterium]HOV40718.1 DeoR/GlpR family DNA-binding transcription regulator [Oscillospiraceae bacterium]
MFALERIKIIKKFLIENNQVEVSTLSEALGVSEVTIRRDLEKLEEEGFLTRTHGGAVINPQYEKKPSPMPQIARPQGIDAKIGEIAQIEVQMINDNDIIMFTNGEINRAASKLLKGKRNLTVLTNDIILASELCSNPEVKVLLLGGDVDGASKAVFGRLAESNLSNFFVNKVFIEVDGINRNIGFTVNSTEKASLIHQIISNSNTAVFVFTSDIINKTAFYAVGAISLADKIITNNDISDEYKHYIFENEVQLFTSIDMYEGFA